MLFGKLVVCTDRDQDRCQLRPAGLAGQALRHPGAALGEFDPGLSPVGYDRCGQRPFAGFDDPPLIGSEGGSVNRDKPANWAYWKMTARGDVQREL